MYLQRGHHHITLRKIGLEVGGLNLPRLERAPTRDDEISSKVLCLTGAINVNLLMGNEECNEMSVDMRDECCKFGTLINVVIFHLNHGREPDPQVLKRCFLEYYDLMVLVNPRSPGHPFVNIYFFRTQNEIMKSIYYPPASAAPSAFEWLFLSNSFFLCGIHGSQAAKCQGIPHHFFFFFFLGKKTTLLCELKCPW